MDVFALRLKKLIQENKTSMYKVSKALNCSKSQVTYWCNGRSEPKLTYIRALAIYFDVSADYLLGLEDETGAKTYINNSFNNFNNSGDFKIK